MLPASSIALFFENIPLKIMIKNDLDCLETKSTEKDLICLLRNKINKEIFENLQIKSQIFKFKIMSLVEILFTLDNRTKLNIKSLILDLKENIDNQLQVKDKKIFFISLIFQRLDRTSGFCFFDLLNKFDEILQIYRKLGREKDNIDITHFIEAISRVLNRNKSNQK